MFPKKDPTPNQGIFGGPTATDVLTRLSCVPSSFGSKVTVVLRASKAAVGVEYAKYHLMEALSRGTLGGLGPQQAPKSWNMGLCLLL